jgi:chitinase-like protein
MKDREVEVLFFTRDKFHYSKNTTQNELTWKLWSEIKTHNIKGEPFHSTKGKINDKGELLVELDTSKYKWIKEDIIAVFKIKGKEGNEKGAYIKEWYSLILHSYPLLTKLAENKATVKVGGLLGIGKVERVELEEEGHSCPRCTAPVTVAQLRELFPDVKEDTLKTVADTYTKYMKELQMDTCWNKAHFFAQAAIETGFKLHIKKGENMKDYTEKRLYEVFPSRFFKGKMVNNEFVPLVDPKAEFRDKKTVFSKVKSYPKKQAN